MTTIRRRTFCLGLTAALAGAGTEIALSEAARAAMRETPYLARRVAKGALPAVAQRIPVEPALAELEELGRPGGDLRLLMASPRDTKMMVVYGYARLVAYTPALALVPDILRSVDVDTGDVFTLHLRKGHRWSDGAPFTSEDFRYWFEDVAQNPQLSPGGLPEILKPGGEAPKFDIIDATTVRFSWSRPNPLFLPALAGAMPLYIYCPSHYLKQFNPKYANKITLASLVHQSEQRNWAALHNKMSAMYRNDNPDLPSLEPWVLRTPLPSQRLIFERNPYYYRVDGAGHQLPYIDRVILSLADAQIIPAKTGAGESDLQARYLSFSDYTFLKAAAARNGDKVRLWQTGPGSELALYPNLNADDPVWRKLFQDVRFRRALSLAINRHEINEVIYFGLGIEGQNTVLPRSPLFRRGYRTAWAGHDPDQANRLLDELGLERPQGGGMRRLPDGRPLDIIVASSGQSSEESDVLELIHDSWHKLGIRLFTKPMQLTLFRNRDFSGETLMSIDKGIENGLATAAMSPWEFAPTDEQQLEWPKWGLHLETQGQSGEAPSRPGAAHLTKLYQSWLGTSAANDQATIWHKMLHIWADEVYSIGLVAGVLQPVVVNERLRNVPRKGVYNWDPGAFFGVYKPDGFWFDDTAVRPQSAALETPPSGSPGAAGGRPAADRGL